MSKCRSVYSEKGNFWSGTGGVRSNERSDSPLVWRFRLKEEIGNVFSLLMTPVFYLGLRKYQPIDIEKLARMIYQTSNDESINDSVRFFESDELQSM